MKHKKKNQKSKKSATTTQTQQVTGEAPQVLTQESSKKQTEKDYKYALPIEDIKKDLIKTSVYAVFAVGVILALYYFMPKSGLQFDLSRYKFF